MRTSRRERDIPVSDFEFYSDLVGQRSRQPAPTLSADEAESEDVGENNLDIFRDDSEVPLTEVLRAQEEPTLANEDGITAAIDDRDYVLDDGGNLVSNAIFIENTTVDVTAQGRGQRKKRKYNLYSSNMWTL